MLFIFGCREKIVLNPEEDKRAVISQIEQLHNLYNAENFEQITDNIYNPDFLTRFIKNDQRNVTIERYKDFYQKYGKMTGVKSISEIQYLSVGNGIPLEQSRYVFIVYQVSFENGSDFTEKFVFSLPEEPKITTYRIKDNSTGYDVF